MLHTHALVSTSPRKHPPADERAAEGPDADLPAAERASDAARTRPPLEGTSLKQVNRQTCPALAALQTTVAQPLSPSVAQPLPPSVARRSARKEGRTRVQNAFKPLPANRGAALRGHAGARHVCAHNSGLSSKHAALRLTQHANKGRAFQQAKRRASRRRLQAAIAVTVSAAAVNETAAAFAPNSRSELQAAAFGCVGACRALSGSGDGCYYGPWTSGTGDPCNNAGDSVPSGQGSGAYGVIGDWDVAKVTSMQYSECLVFCWPHATAHYIYLQQQQQSRVLYTADNLIFFASRPVPLYAYAFSFLCSVL